MTTDETWDESINYLTDFKAKEGHLCIPSTSSHYRWVQKVKSSIGATKNPKQYWKITVERDQDLRDIGFYEAFQVEGKGKGKGKGKEKFMQQMKAFFEEHGHCKVPRNHHALGNEFKNVRYRGMQSLKNLKSYSQQEIKELANWGVFDKEDRRECNGRKTNAEVRKEYFILIS